MIIETKFDLGQTVYRIGRTHENVTLPCKFCRGRASIRVDSPGGDFAYVSCPKCSGRGTARIGAVPKFAPIGSARVGKIQVEIVDETVPGYNGHSVPDRESERYMLSDTGFPSGSVYYHVDLFASEAEAREECDARNERIAAGEVPEQWKPPREAYHNARAFLEHRDVYEHEPEHVERAEAIVAAYEYEPQEALAR